MAMYIGRLLWAADWWLERKFATANGRGLGNCKSDPDPLAVAFGKLVSISPYEFLTVKINFASGI